MSDVKTPQPGEWWFSNKMVRRCFICGFDPDGDPVYLEDPEENAGVDIMEDFVDSWHHEPDCTGWNWQPLPPVESPDDWVDITHTHRDMIPRIGIDWFEGHGNEWTLQDKDHAPYTIGRHHDMCGSHTRCRRRDLPPLPEPTWIKTFDCNAGDHSDACPVQSSPTTPDPGEGWRIAKHDEKPHPKAQYWSDNLKEWTSSACHETNEAYSTRLTYRVPVDPPKPAKRTIVFHEVVRVGFYGGEVLVRTTKPGENDIPTGRTETREVPR